MKKILILGNSLTIGGVQKSLVSLLQSIDYNNYEVDLILNKGGVYKKFIPKKVNVFEGPKYYRWIFIPKNTFTAALISSLGLNLNIIRLIYYSMKGVLTRNMVKSRQELMESAIHTLPNIEGSYDLAIDYTGTFKSLLVKKVEAKKKVSWIHNDYSTYIANKEIDLKIYESLDSIITVTPTSYNNFTTIFPQFKHKTSIIHNISNKKLINKMSNEEIEFDISHKGIKILDLTRLVPNKGLDLAIKSCRSLIDDGYNLKWYILGDGPEKEKVKELIAKYDLEEHFILLGVKSNPYPYIKQADLIVHCSLSEGKSVAIDEAKILAKPIILTNYQSAKDQITNYKTGLICDISVEGVTEAIKLLLNKPDLKQRLVNNLEKFDIPVKESMSKFYNLF